jgi:hypothetical protein
MLPIRRATRLTAALLTLAATTTLVASGPLFWTIATPTELLKGKSDGVTVGLDGAITAGPQLTNRLTTTPAQVWSLATASDGTLWAGTGGDGRLIRMRPGQREETIFTADEKNIFAIAISGTRVYFATGPDGKVYVIDGTAAPRVFFDPSEKYIWALAVDGQGRLWVGAGNPAVIYRVDANGAGQALYKPPAAHVVALARDSRGRMLAGTETPGRLYRFDAADHPFVLIDSGLTEVDSIAVSPAGVVYAAAIGKGEESSSAGESASVAFVTATPPPPGTATAASTTTPASRRSVVYRLDDSGYDTFWESSDVIYDLVATGDTAVIAASGPDGRLYRVDRNRQVQLLGGVDAKQITRLAEPARGSDMPSALASANPGRVVTIGTTSPSTASYTSPVRDAKSVSQWGLIRWNATGAVALYTRSGNTDTPDDSWSAWDGPYAKTDGEPIKSPAARFVQWKATLSGASPRLTSVTVAYLPRNTRPDVTSVTTYPPGVVFQRPFSSDESAIAGMDDATADARRPPGDTGPTPATPSRRMFQKGLQTISWKGDDDDGDRLIYSLQYRREGESTWHELRSGLTDGIFVWDTASVADGRYIVKVLASDSPSNSSDRALVGERESDPIEVDNTPPTITTELVRQGTNLRIAVHVHDARSAILKVEYSLGGAAWQLIAPVDGLADSPDERYEIPVASEADVARVMIRATDALQNVAAQLATIR